MSRAHSISSFDGVKEPASSRVVIIRLNRG